MSAPPPAIPAAPAAEFGLSFRLLPEQSEGGAAAPLMLPESVVALRPAGPGRSPELAEPDPASAVILERLQLGGKHRLLAVAAPAVELRHNDELAPGVALLRQGDHLALAGGLALEFALFSRPFVGAPPESESAVKCPICRQPASAGSRVYRCPCGTYLHASESEDGLQCASVGTECMTCGEPIRFEPGYLGEPEFLPENPQPRP